MRRHTRAYIRYAGSLYRRAFRSVLRPVRKAEAEVQHLLEVERAGESGETPFLAVMGLLLFLVPILAFMLIVAFTAYDLAS